MNRHTRVTRSCTQTDLEASTGLTGCKDSSKCPKAKSCLRGSMELLHRVSHMTEDGLCKHHLLISQ
jgi:hypothetical protein